jgi:hypothetical protein
MRHKDPKNCRLLSLVRNVGMERKKVPTTGRKTIWTLMRFDPNSHSLGLLEVVRFFEARAIFLAFHGIWNTKEEPSN